MENSLFKKFDYYWIFLILVVILSYGFFLTNNSMGIDDEIIPIYGHSNIIIESNRLGNLFFSQILQFYEYLPFWKEFLGLSLYVIGVTCHVENFMTNANFNKKMATIFSCFALSFPYLAFHFIFIENILQHGIIMISTAFAVRYFYKFFNQEKTKLNFIIMFFSLLFAASLYESAVYYFVISCFIIEFFKFVFDKNEKFYNRVVSMCVSAFICVGLNILLCEILKKILHINYSKTNEFLLYDFSSFNGFLVSFIDFHTEFFRKFITTCGYNFGSFIALICVVLLFVFALLYAIRRKNFNIICCAVFITLVPFCSLLLLGNVHMPFRSYAPLNFLVAVVFCLLFYYFKEKKLLSRIIIALVFLSVIYNTQEMNQIFYTENLKVASDKQFAYFIMHDLKRLGLDQKPIIFIGTKENPKLRYNYEESREINLSTFNWDRYDSFAREIFIERSYAFFREIGLEIKSYRELGIESDAGYEELYQDVKKKVKGMGIYPKEGSIKDVGEYVIIKIGDTKGDIE